MKKPVLLTVISIIAGLLLVISGAADASKTAPYIGFGVGSTAYDVDLSALGGKSFDDTGTGTKLYGGYAFNKYYALEAAYYNFAEASVGAIETAPGSGNFVSASADMRGFGVYAVGMYPVTKKFNLMAKLGAFRWNADLNFNQQSASNDGTDLAYAVAASYGFTKELLVTAEWEKFDSDNPEVSLLTVGFKFIFR
jgi:OmpA-OmpF porin, OOP family